MSCRRHPAASPLAVRLGLFATRSRRRQCGAVLMQHRQGGLSESSGTVAFFGGGRPPYRLSFISLTNSGIFRNLASPDVSQKTPSSPRKPAFLSR